MDGSTIPYYVVEERKKLNRCIEEAPGNPQYAGSI